ncbi:hypothetical protein VTK73DRAFT_1920 [Phialemonium thermophilum]|uniref:Uncharacterized protein n=1 Tax=Phialemonium thermophilum TaxID=223376 RepID=A0ABR3Y262_9PEZI
MSAMDHEDVISWILSGDEPVTRDVSFCLEKYLKEDPTVMQRLLEGVADSDKVKKLAKELELLGCQIDGTKTQKL